jgi:hypothetical protein
LPSARAEVIEGGMAKAVFPSKEATFFIVEGFIGDVRLRFMQSKSNGETFWLIGENGQKPEVFEDIIAAKAQWHFLIDLHVMKLMLDAERKEK